MEREKLNIKMVILMMDNGKIIIFMEKENIIKS
jgi:hypothetical protein